MSTSPATPEVRQPPAPPSAHQTARTRGELIGRARGRLISEASNWRLLLVRTVSATVSVIVTVLVVPRLSFDFSQWHWGVLLLVGVVFGLLVAVVKPVLQFFSLRYIIVSFGLSVVVVNALLLWLLVVLFPPISAQGVLPLLVGGVLVGVLGLVLDSLLGASPPFLPREARVRQRGGQGQAS